MVNTVKQRLDSIGERRRVKAQKHLDRLGQLYEFDLVDNVLHVCIETVDARRVRNSAFGVGKYHVAQEHRGHKLAVRKGAGRIPCLEVGLLAHGAFGRAGSSRTRAHCSVGLPHHNLANTGIGLVKDQLHVGVLGQRCFPNRAVNLINLARHAHVAQERYVAFADEFDDVARLFRILAKDFPDNTIRAPRGLLGHRWKTLFGVEKPELVCRTLCHEISP